MLDTDASGVNTTRMRHAGRELLSLGLIDARNHTLRWATVFKEALAAQQMRVPEQPDLTPPLWLLGHVGWFQEYWIARNVQRHRGPACDPSTPRLASLDNRADGFYDPAQVKPAARWTLELPDLAQTKQYLADTMEVTLELLESTDESDEALYFFRLAQLREDMQAERLAQMAQTLGLPLGEARGLVPDIATTAARAPLLFPAQRGRIGSEGGAGPSPASFTPLGGGRGADPASGHQDRGGFVFDNEKWSHDVDVPEFEIDAQPVTWAQYGEFVEDGGYDDAQWWSPDGWAWVQRDGRRVPRHVDQMRQAVLQQRFGRLTRVPMAQPVMHVSWYEADAWCRWAGRRLPSEVEWELAAVGGRSRGFRWGDVWEWTATTFRPYPGFDPDPDRGYSQPAFGTHKSVRGASFVTHGRLRDVRFRNFLEATRDDAFVGFRSCSV